MPCRLCAHYLENPRQADVGYCRLKSDAVGNPFIVHGGDLCEFFEFDASVLDESQLIICRHCGQIAMVEGTLELCTQCAPLYNISQFFREESGHPDAFVRFNCSRPYRERWLKHRLEVKQGGKQR